IMYNNSSRYRPTIQLGDCRLLFCNNFGNRPSRCSGACHLIICGTKGSINMDKPIYTITSEKDDKVFIHAMPGHFISSHSHLSFYIGTSDIKHNHDVSTSAAKLMANYYFERGIKIDSFLCLYETQVLGAYLAHELSKPNMYDPSPSRNIYALGPEYDAQDNIIFRDNLRKLISGKTVVLLISCITSGRTVERAMESVAYYGGTVVGITSIFSAKDEIDGVEVNTIFTKDDVPRYETYPAHDCPLCRSGQKVDAIANGYGYSLL
ncbi:MAG: phosphoribosyltransferase domain-containing protein, partial [Clostridiales bacterium]|nr:phosphoribosyltransferase domain-containing protein [Clostridiales bacterium]